MNEALYSGVVQRTYGQSAIKHQINDHLYNITEKWADPDCSAMPGQPAAGQEQAPETPPKSKNQFNILVPM